MQTKYNMSMILYGYLYVLESTMIRSDDCNELPPLSLFIKVSTWEVQITNPHVDMKKSIIM